MRRRTIEFCHRLTTDESGAIAILFALLLMPMLGMTLTAIDYGRAIRLESHLQQAVDGAAAAAVHKLGQDYSVVQSTARQHLDAQLPDHLKGMDFSLEIAPQNKAVEVRVESSISTSLIGLLGLDKFTVRASSIAYAERHVRRAKSLEVDLPQGLDRDVARALEDASRQFGGGSSGGAAQPTAEQQEELRRAAEEADRMIRDALSRLGR